MKRRFSESTGIVKPRELIQKGSVDGRLWSRLWSAMDKCFWQHFSYESNGSNFTSIVIQEIQDDFFGQTTDTIEHRSRDFVDRLKQSIPQHKWYLIYDLAQFLADFSGATESGETASQIRMHSETFIRLANDILEKEKSAYRFVGGQLIEMTSEIEISSIESAVNSDYLHSGAQKHLHTALALFGDRQKPDYHNSIKEAISSIESVLSSINGEKSKNMTSAMDKAEKKGLSLPPALKQGILKLYGWTSDEDGIRHAMVSTDSRVGEGEAKLIIVLCSAFLNYIILKQNAPRQS